MTTVQKYCPKCSYRAKRRLLKGVYSVSEPGFCPRGHGALEREDAIERGGIVVGWRYS